VLNNAALLPGDGTDAFIVATNATTFDTGGVLAISAFDFATSGNISGQVNNSVWADVYTGAVYSAAPMSWTAGDRGFSEKNYLAAPFTWWRACGPRVRPFSVRQSPIQQNDQQESKTANDPVEDNISDRFGFISSENRTAICNNVTAKQWYAGGNPQGGVLHENSQETNQTSGDPKTSGAH
jgi:hypothetical protein